jgi:hypothetical protein
MLLNVAANNVNIRNIKVSKHECHIMYIVQRHKTYSVTKGAKCTLRNRYKTYCDSIRFVTLYVM